MSLLTIGLLIPLCPLPHWFSGHSSPDPRHFLSLTSRGFPSWLTMCDVVLRLIAYPLGVSTPVSANINHSYLKNNKRNLI